MHIFIETSHILFMECPCGCLYARRTKRGLEDHVMNRKCGVIIKLYHVYTEKGVT